MASLAPERIGVTSDITKKALTQLKMKITEGATHLEMGFMGKGKGLMSQGQITPEMHGKTEREEVEARTLIKSVRARLPCRTVTQKISV